MVTIINNLFNYTVCFYNNQPFANCDMNDEKDDAEHYADGADYKISDAKKWVLATQP